MARLTWNNVDAPSLAGVNQGLATAGTLFGAGSEAIANAFKGITERKITGNSNNAIASLQRFSNVADFDLAMAQGGLAGVLGIDPTQVNADAMRAAQDYRNVILGQADTQAQTRGRDASTAFTQAQTQTELLQPEKMRTDMAQTQAMTEQQKLETQVYNYGYGRQQLGDQIGDAATANKLAGENYITQLLKGNGQAGPQIVNPDDAVYAVLHSGLPQQAQDAAIAVIKDADKFKMLTTPSSATASRVSNMGNLSTMTSASTETQAARDQGYFSDPSFALYNQYAPALQQSLAPGEAQKSILQWAGEVDKLSPTGDPNAIANSAADLTVMFGQLKDANPTAPDSLILAAMQGARQDRAHWILGDFDRIQANYGNIDSIVKQMNDPNFQSSQRAVKTSYDQEKAKWSNLDGRVEKAKLELSRAMDRTDLPADKKQEGIRQANRVVDDLNKEMEGLRQTYPGKIPTITNPDGSVSMDLTPQKINTKVDPASMTLEQQRAAAVAAGKNTPTVREGERPPFNAALRAMTGGPRMNVAPPQPGSPAISPQTQASQAAFAKAVQTSLTATPMVNPTSMQYPARSAVRPAGVNAPDIQAALDYGFNGILPNGMTKEQADAVFNAVMADPKLKQQLQDAMAAQFGG